jgi:hypothetical protein
MPVWEPGAVAVGAKPHGFAPSSHPLTFDMDDQTTLYVRV